MPISCAVERVVVTAAAADIGGAIAMSFAVASPGVFICDIDAVALARMRSRGPCKATASAGCRKALR